MASEADVRVIYEAETGGPAGGLDIAVKSARLQSGLSQGELAARVGISRQAIGAIEAHKVVPTTAVALRIARALGRSVEDLFRLVDHLPSVEAELVGELPADAARHGVRVQVASVGGRIVAHPLAGVRGAMLTLPRANGLIRPASARDDQDVRVDLFADPRQLEQTAVAIGCDPAMSLLAEHVRRRHPTLDFVWQGGNSLAALEAVARGEAHLAGMHLLDPATGEYNLPYVRARFGNDATVVTFSEWQQGLIVAAGNPRGISGPAALARADVRLVNREPGSGARALLDRELAAQGIHPAQVRGFDRALSSHLAVAETVAAGLADVGVGVQAAAAAYSLDFLPLATERYDLVIPSAFVNLAPVQALLETLTSPLFRLEVAALGGYNVAPMGNLVAPAA